MRHFDTAVLALSVSRHRIDADLFKAWRFNVFLILSLFPSLLYFTPSLSHSHSFSLSLYMIISFFMCIKGENEFTSVLFNQ